MANRPTVSVDRAELAALRTVYLEALALVRANPDVEPVPRGWLGFRNAVVSIENERAEATDPWAAWDLAGEIDRLNNEMAEREDEIRSVVHTIRRALADLPAWATEDR